LAAGYHFKPAAPYIKAATISVKVSNLFNNRDVSDFAGYQAVGSAETFWRNPGISAFLNFDGKF
jgi:iron complex outermembrane receptor protein